MPPNRPTRPSGPTSWLAYLGHLGAPQPRHGRRVPPSAVLIPRSTLRCFGLALVDVSITASTDVAVEPSPLISFRILIPLDFAIGARSICSLPESAGGGTGIVKAVFARSFVGTLDSRKG